MGTCWGTHWELGEHVKNSLRTSCEQQKSNTPTPPQMFAKLQTKRNKNWNSLSQIRDFLQNLHSKNENLKKKNLKKCCHFADVWKVYFGQFFKKTKSSLNAKSILWCTSPLLLQKIGNKKTFDFSQFTSLIYFHNLLRWLLSQKIKIKFLLIIHYFNLTHLNSEIQMCQANSFCHS